MKVRQLTTDQKDLLIGQTFDGVQYFNPTLDANGNWFISNEEVNGCIHESVNEWIHTLEEIDYNPIIHEKIN
jgi:hypothetical protein